MEQNSKNINSFPEDPMWLKWVDKAPQIYDEIYYNTNRIVSAVNNYGHYAVEKAFGPDKNFSRVLEIGAGTGMHLEFVRHRY